MNKHISKFYKIILHEEFSTAFMFFFFITVCDKIIFYDFKWGTRIFLVIIYTLQNYIQIMYKFKLILWFVHYFYFIIYFKVLYNYNNSYKIILIAYFCNKIIKDYFFPKSSYYGSSVLYLYNYYILVRLFTFKYRYQYTLPLLIRHFPLYYHFIKKIF